MITTHEVPTAHESARVLLQALAVSRAGAISVQETVELYRAMPQNADSELPAQIAGANPNTVTTGYGFGSAI